MADGASRSDAATSPQGLARLLRERDDLFLLHEALADVQRAATIEQRLRILVQAIQRLGYGEVEKVDQYSLEGKHVVARISSSTYLDTGELLVPMRAVNGATIATLVLREPVDANAPTLPRVRTVELFAQQVASIIETARLYDESQRERGRGEAISDIARAVSASLRQDEVMHLSLRHAVALLHAEGAALALQHEDQLIVVAGIGPGERLVGAPVPMNDSLAGLAVRERRANIVNDSSHPGAYTPTRIAANIERTINAPLLAVTGAIGVLTVINRETPFTQDDAAVLQRLADQVAAAISNARLYEEARATAERYRQAVEDERRARGEVAAVESRYARLVEAASDAIFTLGADGLMAGVNRSLERSSGKSRAELIGAPFPSLLDPRDQQVAANAIEESLVGLRRRVELRYSSVEGDPRLCSLTLTPLVEGGEVTGALGIVRDVTDERRMTEQLMQQEKLAAIGQLVSGVAHELNNPLASVMAFAQLLIAAPLDAPRDAFALDAINQEAKRAAKIVSNLLTFARQHQPERMIADVNAAVRDTIDLHRYALRIADVEIDLRLDPDLPLTWADPFQLQQVVLNLVTNAEQALSARESDRRLTITTEARDRQIVVRVSDNGPGIASEHLSRIFNPFFTTKPVGEGTGLGLSISDGIMREHGGRLRAESPVGEGATFVLELPLVTPPHGSDAVSDESVATKPSAGRRLLVVDDEPALRSAISTFFRSMGHTVDLAPTGRDGVDLASRVTYDAMLLDLRLPDMTGDEVLAELEAKACAPRRVVFVTGDTQSDAARSTLGATGRPIVSKPFLLDELAAIVLAEGEA
ncbi:MAG TPA: ATP-binding protein [Gemmatimonadaceae bacterium]|jgi:two-component system NtrC family sensor kinase